MSNRTQLVLVVRDVHGYFSMSTKDSQWTEDDLTDMFRTGYTRVGRSRTVALFRNRAEALRAYPNLNK